MAKIVGSRTRVLHVLRLFESQSVWTVEALALRLGVSTSSVYRDVQELSRAGFLSAVASAGYMLGPAFIHYDRLIRRNDPLVEIATPMMRELLVRTTQRATVVLCRRFRDCVMCVHQQEGSAPHAPTSYERGVAMPLFTGATSKVFLAFCDDRTLRATYRENEDEIRRTMCCSSWKEFREEMRKIRDCGFALTISEVAQGQVGLAAPILEKAQPVAGLSLVLRDAELTVQAREAFPKAVIEAAHLISKAMPLVASWRVRA